MAKVEARRGKVARGVAVMAVAAGAVFGAGVTVAEEVTAPDPIAACRMAPRNVTVTSAIPHSRWVNEQFTFVDSDGDGYGQAWIEEYVDGVYLSGGLTLVPATNRVPFFWADVLAGIEDQARYFSVDSDGNKVGEELCRVTARYPITKAHRPW